MWPFQKYTPKKHVDRWDFYRDDAGKWRWKRTARNGLIVGASCQGYVRKIDCNSNAERHGFHG